VTSFVAGVFINTATKAFLESCNGSELIIKRKIINNLNNVDEITTSSRHEKDIIINRPTLMRVLEEKLNGTEFGGAFVFDAPMGSGKSTYLKMFLLQEYTKRKGQNFWFKVITSGTEALLNRNVGEILGVPKGCPLSDFLPKNTIIAIDQVDFRFDINQRMQSYIAKLATDSYNSACYKVIFCVSSAMTAAAILACNGYEKITCLCPELTELIWTKYQVEQYTLIMLPHLSNIDRERLLRLAAKCRNSPGLIHKASLKQSQQQREQQSTTTTGKNVLFFTEEEWKTLEIYARNCNVEWKKFRAIGRRT